MSDDSDAIELGDGLLLWKWTDDDGDGQLRFPHYIKNTMFKRVTFTLDCSPSKNICLGEGIYKQITVLNPGEKKSVGVPYSMDPSKTSKLDTTYFWKEGNPDEATIKREIERNSVKIRDVTRKASKLKVSRVYNEQELRKECAENKTNFVDMSFLPRTESIYSKTNKAKRANDNRGMESVCFSRIGEFLDEDFTTFADPILASDLQLGDEGTDYWLFSALACLCERPDWVHRLLLASDGVGTQVVNEQGVYQVCMYVDGRPQRITVDDYIATKPHGGPIHIHSLSGDSWSMLVEKAFAKVYRSYDALCSGGFVSEALADLTGMCSIRSVLSDGHVSQKMEKGVWWDEFAAAVGNAGNLVVACTQGEEKHVAVAAGDAGGPELLFAHGYTVLKALRAGKSGARIVKLRNPYVSALWKGDYGVGDAAWDAEGVARDAGVNKMEIPTDRTFWMSLADFLKHFASVTVCSLESKKGKAWETWRKRIMFDVRPRAEQGHEWVNESDEAHKKGTGGGSAPGELVRSGLRHAIRIAVPADSEPIDMLVSLQQHDTRIESSRHYIDLGIVIAEEHQDEGSRFKAMASSGPEPDRTVAVSKPVVLQPGHTYVVAAFTAGALLAKLKRKKAPATPHVLVNEEERRLTAKGEEAVRLVFNSAADIDLDGFMGRDDLEHFFRVTDGTELSNDVYCSMQHVCHSDGAGRLTEEGLVDRYNYLIRMRRRDNESILRDLRFFGLTEALKLEASFPVALSLYTSVSITDSMITGLVGDAALSGRDWDTLLSSPVRDLGLTMDLGDNVSLRTFIGGPYSVTVAVENQRKDTVSVTVDSGQSSRNAVSCVPATTLTQVIDVPPNSLRRANYLMPEIVNDMWHWGFQTRWKVKK